MIVVCDVEKVGHEVKIVDQRDFNIPDLSKVNFILDVCLKTNCDLDCSKCIIKRITTGRGKDE